VWWNCEFCIVLWSSVEVLGFILLKTSRSNGKRGNVSSWKWQTPTQPKQPRREFNNYSGNFLNICLTARTWPLVTSICLAC
jgi:hypothetical protein